MGVFGKVEGLVLASAWDASGLAVGYLISTPGEEEYEVLPGGMRDALGPFLRGMVEAEGTVYDEGGRKSIRVETCRFREQAREPARPAESGGAGRMAPGSARK
jgi:hypothetical protein